MTKYIYLLRGDQELEPMSVQTYESEAQLQELLASHPDLLAGDQINERQPRRWLLVSREVKISSQVTFSLDHLFLDQEGIPTFVEVKRSSDGRVRREVVGQMLDYTANAVNSWTIESVRSVFESRCRNDSLQPDQELERFLDEEVGPEAFWALVKANLEAARFRLLFVADAIPLELRRIVEFLNDQMDRSEVLALEIKQYLAEGVRILVPRIHGQTQRAQIKKHELTKWQPRQLVTQKAFLEEFENCNGASQAAIVRRIIDWTQGRGLSNEFLRGTRGVSYEPRLDFDPMSPVIFKITEKGALNIPMRQLKELPPFDSSAVREVLHGRLSEVGTVRVTEHGMSGFPTLQIADMDSEESWSALTSTLEWIAKCLRDGVAPA